MPWILSGLAASVATWFVSSWTNKPTINIAQGEVKSEEEQRFFKWGFYALAGFVALFTLKKLAK